MMGQHKKKKRDNEERLKESSRVAKYRESKKESDKSKEKKSTKEKTKAHCILKTCIKHLYNRQIYCQYVLNLDLLCDYITSIIFLEYFLPIFTFLATNLCLYDTKVKNSWKIPT
mgnify:CR=1 FL=1